MKGCGRSLLANRHSTSNLKRRMIPGEVWNPIFISEFQINVDASGVQPYRTVDVRVIGFYGLTPQNSKLGGKGLTNHTPHGSTPACSGTPSAPGWIISVIWGGLGDGHDPVIDLRVYYVDIRVLHWSPGTPSISVCYIDLRLMSSECYGVAL